MFWNATVNTIRNLFIVYFLKSQLQLSKNIFARVYKDQKLALWLVDQTLAQLSLQTLAHWLVNCTLAQVYWPIRAQMGVTINDRSVKSLSTVDGRSHNLR